MIGMKSNPQQDLQSLQPALNVQQAAPGMTPSMPQMPQMPQAPQMPGAGMPPMPGMGGAMPQMPKPQMGGMPPLSGADPKKSLLKDTVKKAAKGAAKAAMPGAATAAKLGKSALGGMSWITDFLNKRHESSLSHEREMLNNVLKQQAARGGGAPDSMKGHEQDYFDNVRNQ